MTKMAVYMWILCAVFLVLLVFVGFEIRGLVREKKEFDITRAKDIHYDPDTRILTFIGGFSGARHSYVGSCTVWRDMNGRRLDVIHEGWLCDIWRVWKSGQA